MHCYFVLLLLSSVTVSFSKLPDILARDMEHQEFSCEGLVCRALGRIFGAINMGVFTSVSTDYSLHTSKTTANLVAGLASSVGAPFFMLGFFNEESDYNLELDWKLAYEKARHGALSIGAASSGAGVAFSRIIEFKDVDGDKKYSPADAVVSAYPLIGRKWNKMVVNEAKNKEITSLTYNFSTTNGLASFEYTMNSESHPLSPYGAKIAIEVTGYDYKETSGTALAVEAVFISTEANATAMASVEFGNSNMSYTWEQHSILFDQISAEVHASSAFIAEVSILDNGFASAFAAAAADASYCISKVYFSIDAEQPKKVHWTSRLLYSIPYSTNDGGDGKDPRSGLSGIQIGLLVAGCTFVIGATGTGIVFHRRKKRGSEYSPLIF